MTAFEEFGVLPEIGKAVDDMGWGLPTDIQSEAIPLILGGGDVLLAAETGSGKTGAFCLPVLQITWESLKVCTLHSCPKYVFILLATLATLILFQPSKGSSKREERRWWQRWHVRKQRWGVADVRPRPQPRLGRGARRTAMSEPPPEGVARVQSDQGGGGQGEVVLRGHGRRRGTLQGWVLDDGG